MTDNQIIQFSFTVDDPELDDEDRHAIALQLLPQLKQIDEVESVERTEVKDPQAGSRVGLETLIGFLTLEVNRENFQKVLGWLHNRVKQKGSISLVVGDISIKVDDSADLAQAEQTVLNILDKMKQ